MSVAMKPSKRNETHLEPEMLAARAGEGGRNVQGGVQRTGRTPEGLSSKVANLLFHSPGSQKPDSLGEKKNTEPPHKRPVLVRECEEERSGGKETHRVGMHKP